MLENACKRHIPLFSKFFPQQYYIPATKFYLAKQKGLFCNSFCPPPNKTIFHTAFHKITFLLQIEGSIWSMVFKKEI